MKNRNNNKGKWAMDIHARGARGGADGVVWLSQAGIYTQQNRSDPQQIIKIP